MVKVKDKVKCFKQICDQIKPSLVQFHTGLFLVDNSVPPV